jgi:hypothetical protein
VALNAREVASAEKPAQGAADEEDSGSTDNADCDEEE